MAPDPDLERDAPALIGSMLAAGMSGGRAWVVAIRRMDERYADQGWAMLALGAPETTGLDLSFGRVNAFISAIRAANKKRSALWSPG